MQPFIYADNAATTALSKVVLDEMMPYLTNEYGNASSLYDLGSRAKAAVNLARERVAKAIGAMDKEIYFFIISFYFSPVTRSIMFNFSSRYVNITLVAAITGVATIIPMIPKKCPKINSPSIIVTGCNFIVCPMING